MKARFPAALAVALLLVTGAAVACSGGRPAVPTRLVIAAGGVDDVYHLLGEALGAAARQAGVPEVEVRVTGGSVENLDLVADGEAEIGFATVDAAAIAMSGNAPFHTALRLAALARLHDDYLQVVTLADSSIGELADLSGRRISLPPTGSGSDIAAARVLHEARVSPGREDGLDPGAAVRALGDGEIDAAFLAGGLPTPVVGDLAGQVPVRLLSLAGLVDGFPDQYGEYYRLQSIPAGTYGDQAEVLTLAVPNLLVVSDQLPEETAHWVTKLLFQAKPELVAAHVEARRLDHRSALATVPIELHPGARRYYREAKPRAIGGSPRPVASAGSQSQSVAVFDDGLHQVGAGGLRRRRA